MRTILILANSISGLFSFRKEVVKAIVDAGFSVVIIVPEGDNQKMDYFRSIGCVISVQQVDRRGTNPLKDFKLMMAYYRLMKRYVPVAVLTYTIKPNIFGGMAARLAGVPQLANITGLGSAIQNPGVFQKFTLALYKLGLSKANTVFYQNSFIKDFCKKYRLGGYGVQLPGSGVDLLWHSYHPYPKSNSPLKFLFIGRVMRDKGIEEFFEMVNRIQVQYEQIEFHILGGCEEDYKSVLDKMQAEHKLIWHGSVPDVRPYIKEAHCTIHPSYHEGMANVLLETCAAGRPVITTNVSGCKEAVNDGINGFLCDVKSADSLTEQVERFIHLPYVEKIEMGVAARKKMEQEFNRSIVVSAYLDEINKVCDL